MFFPVYLQILDYNKIDVDWEYQDPHDPWFLILVAQLG